jgi:hypothetical protein
MPVFYFHIENGGSLTDGQGLMLHDARAARNRAQLLDTALDSRGPKSSKKWTITVTDEQTNVVYEIRREL